MSNLSDPVALATIRRLSGTENYPFHLEGEIRLAGVLAANTASVEHARAVVDEFDGERCPSAEALRSMALRMAEKCRCGRALWQHRGPLPDCARFYGTGSSQETVVPADFTPEDTAKRLSVPMLPGVPWFVSLQIECLYIAGRTGKSDYMPTYERDYPEALSAARRGSTIDASYVERRMRELLPHMFRLPANRIPGLSTIEERLKQLDDGVAVQKF